MADELDRALAVWDGGTLSDLEELPTRDAALEAHYRVQRLRRAFSVLLAHALDYGGPVSKYDFVPGNEKTGWLPDPATSEADRAVAKVQYRVEGDIEVSSVWPEFRAPELPDTDLVRQFVAFADGLREHTGGGVIARLRPLPVRDGEAPQFSFRLLLGADPSVYVALFSVELSESGLIVRGWRDEPVEVTDQGGLRRFTDSVASSADLKYQVERLLLLGDDVGRGESLQAS